MLMKMKTTKCLAALMFSLVVMSACPQADQGVIYDIEAVFYVNGSGSLERIEAVHGSPSFFQSEKSDYEVAVVSQDGKTLLQRYIHVSFGGAVAFMKPQENDPEADAVLGPVNQTNVNVRLPYFPEARKILFLRLGDVILDVDLSRDLCDRDDSCDLGENAYNCPDDCGLASTTTQERVSTTKKPSTVTLVRQTTTLPSGGAGGGFFSFIGLLIVLGLLGGIAYFIYQKRKERI